jgi:uncharacterized membrane protein
MSGRDWSAIGTDVPRDRAPLPPWRWWAIPPLLTPLGAMAWMGMRWDRIPLRYATRFGPGGRPNGWQTRTPLHVYGPLIFAEGLVALILALALTTWYGSRWYGSRRSASRSPMDTIPLAVMYLLGLVFSGVGLTPVAQIPPWTVVLLVPLLVLGVVVYVVRQNSQPDESIDDTPNQCWSLSGNYRNPQDPALFVRARMGTGYTLNLGNPWSYRFVIGLFAGIGVLTGFLIWSQR